MSLSQFFLLCCSVIAKLEKAKRTSHWNPAMKPKAHQWHYPSINGVFVCGQCKRPFRTRKGVRMHKLNYHLSIREDNPRSQKFLAGLNKKDR